MQWIADVGMQKIDIAEKQLLKELNGFENYDPYNQGDSVNSKQN